MYNVIYLKKARKSLDAAIDWYNEKQDDLGNLLLAEIQDKLTAIKKQPDRYAAKFKNFREVRVTKFPYLIVYRIDETHNTIIITNIFHVKQNPNSKY